MESRQLSLQMGKVAPGVQTGPKVERTGWIQELGKPYRLSHDE